MPLTVFISYSTASLNVAKRLRKRLELAGVSVWIDHEQLVPGTPNWETAIRDGIRASSVLIYLGSPAALASPYVQSELLVARRFGRRIIPLWIEGNNWIDAAPLDMGKVQYIDARYYRFEDAVIALLSVLGIQFPPSVRNPLPGRIQTPGTEAPKIQGNAAHRTTTRRMFNVVRGAVAVLTVFLVSVVAVRTVQSLKSTSSNQNPSYKPAATSTLTYAPTGTPDVIPSPPVLASFIKTSYAIISDSPIDCDLDVNTFWIDDNTDINCLGSDGILIKATTQNRLGCIQFTPIQHDGFVTASAQPSKGDVVLGFRVYYTGYYFSIDPSAKTYAIYSVDGNGNTTRIPGGSGMFTTSSLSNVVTVGILYRGNQITPYVNGVSLPSIKDDSYFNGSMELCTTGEAIYYSAMMYALTN